MIIQAVFIYIYIYLFVTCLYFWLQNPSAEHSANLKGSWGNEGDVVVVQRERLEGGQSTKGPF